MDEHEFNIAFRKALLMLVDALERLENSLAEQAGKPLPYAPRTAELRRAAKSERMETYAVEHTEFVRP